MCLAFAPLIAGIGSAVSVAGSVIQGNQAAAAYEGQAKAIEQQAEARQSAAAFEAMQTDRRSQLALAAGRAQVGASGVAFAGSPTEVLKANAGQAQMDLEAIKFGSVLERNNLRTQAQLSRMQGKQARTAGFIEGISGGFDRVVRMGENPFK